MSADNLGMVDVPVKLLIAVIITSMAVPMVWSAYTDLSVTATQNSTESEARELLDVVQTVMDSGVGTTMVHELHLRSWGSSALDSFSIGTGISDIHEVNRYLVSYSIRDLGDGFMSLDPPVAMLSDDGVTISDGTYRIMLEHRFHQNEHVCWLEVQ
jgi:hypothetical protein